MKEKDKLIFGRKPLIEILEAGGTLERIYLHNQMRADIRGEIIGLAKQHGVPVQFVPKIKLDKLVSGNHQGIVALGGLIRYMDIQAVIAKCYDEGRDPLIAVLDSITDVRNFGAIARTAEVMGVDALLIGWQHAAPVNAFAMKASAGALSRIPVCRTRQLSDSIQAMKASGLTILAATLEATDCLDEIHCTGPVTCLLGAEDTGLPVSLLAMSDKKFRIRQFGQSDSLNVSVAAGIIFYEIQRQRKTLAESKR